MPRFEFNRIVAPTLSISTADDLYGTFEDARFTAEHIPNARFVGYESGRHMLIECNVAAHAEVVAFLKGSARF